MHKNKLIYLVTLLLIIGLVVSGCSTSGTTSGSNAKQQSGDTFIIAEPAAGDWGFPTPYSRIARGPGFEKMILIFDTLVWKDDTGLVPALAKKWDYNEKDKSYKFELNSAVKWHDGIAFSAKDVAFTIAYFKQYPNAGTNTDEIERVEVLDDYNLKIYLKDNYVTFLSEDLAGIPILPEHIWAKVKNPEKFQGPESVIGTGPYKFVDFSKERGTYSFEANDDYFLGKPKFRKLNFVTMSPGVVATALKKGEANFTTIQYEQTDDLKASGFTVMTPSYDWIIKLMINQKKAPFSSREFRQALAYAINRDELVKVARRGDAVQGNPGIVTSDSDWYNPDTAKYEYSPDKAKSILSGMGYQLKDNFFIKDGKVLEVSLLLKAGNNPKSNFTREAELVKKQLEKAGIKVNLLSLESKTVDGMIKDWKFDIAITGHGGVGGDPEFLSTFILDKSFTSSRYSDNKELVRILNEQLVTPNPQERLAKIKKAQELIAEDVPVIPLLYIRSYFAHDGKINFFFNKKGFTGGQRPLNKMAFVKG